MTSRNKVFSLVSIIALTGIIASIGLTGCASLETDAYKVIGSIAVSTDGARKGWNDYVRAGHASVQQVKDVADAYDKYTSAMAVAESAVTSYKTGATDKTALQKALDAVIAASGDMIALVNKFNPPKP